MAVIARIRQGLGALMPGTLPDERDQLLAQALSPSQRDAFLQLPAYDQRHLCAVYRSLRASHPADRELQQAGLLHDLGKAALGGHVRLFDRVLYVLLSAALPRLRDRMTQLPAPRWRLGLALAHHHPTLGADWAERLGCPSRVCWLIRHHADAAPPDDPALCALIAADRTA